MPERPLRKGLAAATPFRATLLAATLLAVFGLWVATPTPARADDKPPAPAAPGALPAFSSDHISVKLVTDAKTVQPGTSFLAGLKFVIDAKWHVYWENPGETGLPVTYEWTLPDGWKVSPILWPAPVRTSLFGMVSYAYEGTFVLPARITVPAEAKGQARIELKPDWLVCHEECLPCQAPVLGIDVVVASTPPEPSDEQPLFEAAKKLWPQPLPADVALEAVALERALELHITGKGPWAAAETTIYVYTLQEQLAEGKQREVVDANVPQPVRREGDVTAVKLPYPKRRKEPPARLTGMFVVEGAGARQAFALDVPVKVAPPPPAPAPAPVPPEPPGVPKKEAPPGSPPGAAPVDVLEELPPAPAAEAPLPLPLILIFAFLGGVILNLMPCVLPVLSIKILGFVSQADEDPARVRRHGYAFAVGVLASFWVLAGAIQAFKAAGDEVGWGFQLQYPGTIAVLAAMMVAVGLNLFGVFEMGTSVMNLAGDAAGKIHSGGYSASFWSGVLATAIATPCTAPFMAGAVGYAMTAPAFESVLTFTLLGLGMATPYVLLTANPRLLKKVPRPGPWMETFKRVLAFPMFAVAAWLVGVLGKQTNLEGVKWMLYGLLVLGVGLWVYGHWGTPERSPKVRRIVGYGVAALFLAVAAWMIVLACSEKPKGIADEADDAQDTTVVAEPSGEWEPWTPKLVRRYLRAGYPVFVDFTADWCQSCKANEHLFIDTDAVHATVGKHKVAMLQADFTSRDETILKYLKTFGRAGVPVYVMYSPAPDAKPEVLPTVITTSMVVEAMTKAATRAGVPIRTASLPPATPPQENGK